jgi:PIN domain nuclease of toxin-antitoxin system
LILLDTHIVLWVAFDAARLSKKAKTTIAEARQSGEGVAIPDITPLESAMLARKKHIPLGLSLGSFLPEVEGRFVVLPMNGHICERAFAPRSTYPKDPADHLIAATALVQGLSLVTAIGYRPTAKSVDRMPFPKSGESSQFSPTLGFRVLEVPDLPVSPQICLNYLGRGSVTAAGVAPNNRGRHSLSHPSRGR